MSYFLNALSAPESAALTDRKATLARLSTRPFQGTVRLSL
jgi:hypothetical protein